MKGTSVLSLNGGELDALATNPADAAVIIEHIGDCGGACNGQLATYRSRETFDPIAGADREGDRQLIV